jgi:hypothetical protein
MELVREGEDYETSGLGAFNGPMAGRWQVSMMTDDYDFPDDWDAYTSLLSKINSRYIYFAVKTYADGITLHFPNHAIAIASAHKIDHDYPNGKKRLTLTFRFRYPHNEIIPA